MTFQEVKEKFEEERATEDGYKIMNKVTDLINHIGSDFLTMDGGELSDVRTKLAGYKFHISDYIHDLHRISKSIDIDLKNKKAKDWDRITEEIKARDGKVKNKTQIENVLELATKEEQYSLMLYETMYYKYKMKVSAIDDVLMAITQRVKTLQKELEQQNL